jgi:hypothetical protein
MPKTYKLWKILKFHKTDQAAGGGAQKLWPAPKQAIAKTTPIFVSRGGWAYTDPPGPNATRECSASS